MGGHTLVSNASHVPAGNRAMTSKASGLREPLRGMGAPGRAARGSEDAGDSRSAVAARWHHGPGAQALPRARGGAGRG